MAKSKSGEMNKEDWIKTLKGLGIGVGGAAITYLLEMIPHTDFGVYTPLIVAVSCAGLNFLRKLLQG